MAATVRDVVVSRRLASWIRTAARKRPGDIPVIVLKRREKWNLLNIATLASSSIVRGSPSLSRIAHNARRTAISPINNIAPLPDAGSGPSEREGMLRQKCLYIKSKYAGSRFPH